MHNLDLGVWLYMINNFEYALTRLFKDDKSRAEAAVKEINRRISEMPHGTDLTIPTCGGRGYIPNTTNLQAIEHRTMMMLMPHLVHGFHPKLTEMFCRCVCTCCRTEYAVRA